MNTRFWAIIPAAGTGTRMGGDIPKQYLPLAGRTVIEHVLDVFLAHPRIAGISVAIAETDTYWRQYLLRSRGKPLRIAKGGVQRARSVSNLLQSLRQELNQQDWVLVHDAVRPCLQASDLDRLMETLRQDPVGGILATPLIDTVKSVDPELRISATPERQNLWRAFTPQMFRYGLLLGALDAALKRGEMPSDEAAAMESAGHPVRVVEGRSDNIKITRPEDLALAEAILNKTRGRIL
ncbi:MAG: 2-C-methyl-D-erythritol 4-phosphate cytidylyltransferase [Gammaproteobacteria bacterium]